MEESGRVGSPDYGNGSVDPKSKNLGHLVRLESALKT